MQKQAKEIVASAMKADGQDDDEFTARIDAAIKKRSGTSSVSAVEVKTAEVAKKKDLTEQDVKNSQKAA